MTNTDDITKYLDEQLECISKIKNDKIDSLNKILQIIENARDRKNQIIIVGNGGSASTASHFTSDLLKTSIIDNKTRFRAISLTDNMPVISAWANDLSYDDIFVGQLENFLQNNDVVIGISGSGNSVNVIKAVEFANKNGAHSISFTGKDGGKLAKLSSANLTIPSFDMLTIETMHLLICHIITTILRKQGKPLFSY